MGQASLVAPDIATGSKLVEALDRSDLQIEAAFWWLDEDSWKLILATPLVHEQGPRIVYSKVRDIIESTPDVPRDLFERVEAVSPSAGVITVLDIGADRHLPVRRFVLNESLGGVYIVGAYFYKFQPKSFAKTS